MAALASEMTSRYPGEVGDFGHRQAEHSRGIEDSGIRDLEAIAGRLGESGRQEFLAAATHRRSEIVQRVRGVALAGAMSTFGELERAQPGAHARQ